MAEPWPGVAVMLEDSMTLEVKAAVAEERCRSSSGAPGAGAMRRQCSRRPAGSSTYTRTGGGGGRQAHSAGAGGQLDDAMHAQRGSAQWWWDVCGLLRYSCPSRLRAGVSSLLHLHRLAAAQVAVALHAAMTLAVVLVSRRKPHQHKACETKKSQARPFRPKGTACFASEECGRWSRSL